MRALLSQVDWGQVLTVGLGVALGLVLVAILVGAVLFLVWLVNEA